uniref:Mesothelin-like protein-like n=1 Tax=Scleropages formosus TaxID=113540 RepID=A0A8C9UY59_SCLFO
MSLGTLITGVPSAAINSISSSELLAASKSQQFITNIIQAPEIVQQTFVSKIISLNQDPNTVIDNVPAQLAVEIPRVLLSFSKESVQVDTINNKTWSQEQAVVFFENVARVAEDPEILSPSVLQGFTCSGVRNFNVSKVKNIIRAFRPRQGRPTVPLTEMQSTCMYNYIRDENLQDFTNYPSDMLLYYNYENIEKINCKSYFNATGAANFGILSKILNKEASLLYNAISCLGISGTNLTRDQVEILGNMVCTLNASFIENSDPVILENLKHCSGFSEGQVTAMENLLFTGTTLYGNVSTWSLQTLKNLEILPLYLTARFWEQFSALVKKQFLSFFLPQLREKGTELQKLRSLFQQYNSIRSKLRWRSGLDHRCTTGNITCSTIVDQAFPFGYSLSQFDLCLDANIVKNNQEVLISKVVDVSFQGVILNKLKEAYPSGLADEQVQQLRSVSRVASLDDINKWNITKIDTLFSLMISTDGEWESAKSKVIIMKYLGTAGNSLGTPELNCIGGVNLCSLDVSVIRTISSSSLSNAKPLDISNCSTEQKKELYQKANESFSQARTDVGVYYQFISPYLGEASQLHSCHYVDLC